MKTFQHQVLIAHAKGEENLPEAEQLAEAIQAAGYEIAHRGTVMVGESFIEEASKVLNAGGPVVLCGTSKAAGQKWARLLVNAARNKSRVFCVQMEEEADLDSLTFDEQIARYWQDPIQANQALVAALQKYYPLEVQDDFIPTSIVAEERYRELALEYCDIIDLANLPQPDRHIVTRKLELRRLYVALRVQVEISSEVEPEKSDFEVLEKQRRERQLSLAPWLRKIDGSRIAQRDRVPIGTRLAKSRRLVVLGDPGAGKTTMLRWIATAYLLRLKGDSEWKDLPDIATLPDENWLPIIIRCRDLDESCLQGALDDFLCFTLRKAEISEEECEALRELLPRKLKLGAALLLIDGLDEITDPATRARFCQQIERICIAYPEATVILTSRIVGYREMGYRLGRGFEHVTVVDFIREDKDDFAQRWCAVTEMPERRDKATEDLIQDIHSTDRIERLTGNPMLLTTMALVKRKVGKLPSRRVDLYWEAVQVLLNWRQEVDSPIDHREAVPQLEYLAYAMCDRGVQQLREDEILAFLHQMRQEYPQIHQLKDHTPEEFLRLLERRTGILVEVGEVRHNGKPISVFEFRHLTFQEYLAGLALVEGRFPNRDRNLSLAECVAPLATRMSEMPCNSQLVFPEISSELVVTENWREALRLCIAACNDDDVDSLLRAILNPLDKEETTTARPRAVMAALCLADEPNVSDAVAQEVLSKLAEHIQEHDGLGLPRSSLDYAVIELAKSRWIVPLRSALLREYMNRQGKQRANCGGLIAMAGSVSISSDEEEEIKTWLLEKTTEIGLMNEDSILAALDIMQLAYQRNAYIVSGIIDGLLEMLKANSLHSFAAAWALAWLNRINRANQKKECWKPSEKDIEAIIGYVENPDSDGYTVRFLSWVCSNEKLLESVQPLLTKLDHPNEDVRQAVASALGEIKDPCAVEPLITKLNDPHESVRRSAASALRDIKEPCAVGPLIAKLNDPNEAVRQAAARVLGTIKDIRAVEPLVAKLDDPSEAVRQAAASALGDIKDIRAVEPLIVKLDDPNESVRRVVASALGAIKDIRAVKPLIAKLDDSSEAVREAAASALGAIKDIRAVKPLIAKLDDSSEAVREAAASALGDIKDIRAVDPLIAKLDDSSEAVREAAASALGDIKDPRAVDPLIAKLDNLEEGVHWFIARSLVMLGHEQTILKLFELLNDDQRDTRTASLQALSALCNDETDRKLLSRDLDALDPFLDPEEDIGESQIQSAAETLEIPMEEVITRYQSLAQQFSLKLKIA